MFLKACEPDLFCLKASSPVLALVWVSLLPPLLKFREVRSGLPFQGGTGTKHCTILSKMTPLANSSRPYPLDLAAWKCASNVLFRIIRKINSLPRVVLKARLPHPQLFVARRNVTAVPALQRVAWGGSDLQQSVLPIPDGWKKYKKPCPKALHSLVFLLLGSCIDYSCFVSRRWHRKMLGGQHYVGLCGSLNRKNALNCGVCGHH